jgi:adenine phosphoribosyltransferase
LPGGRLTAERHHDHHKPPEACFRRNRKNRFVPDFKEDFLARFRWIDGHADMLGLLADGEFLARAVEALAEPFQDRGITKVAAVEARGFVLAGGVALELGVGFVGIRKGGSIHPGPKAERTAEPDWRGNRNVLRVQRRALGPDDVVLVVDDWAEIGSQATAARALLEECGASYAGLTLLVDELEDEVRQRLAPVHAIVTGDELPPN